MTNKVERLDTRGLTFIGMEFTGTCIWLSMLRSKFSASLQCLISPLVSIACLLYPPGVPSME